MKLKYSNATVDGYGKSTTNEVPVEFYGFLEIGNQTMQFRTEQFIETSAKIYTNSTLDFKVGGAIDIANDDNDNDDYRIIKLIRCAMLDNEDIAKELWLL